MVNFFLGVLLYSTCPCVLVALLLRLASSNSSHAELCVGLSSGNQHLKTVPLVLLFFCRLRHFRYLPVSIVRIHTSLAPLLGTILEHPTSFVVGELEY